MLQTRLVHVCDREADFFELFDEQRRNRCVELLVRAKHNRNTSEEPFKLFEKACQASVSSRVQINIPRQSARPRKSKQKTRPARPGRLADMAQYVFCVSNFVQPHYLGDKESIGLWLVHAVEENPPADTKAVEWFLLTTIEITSAADAEQCLR